MRKRWHDIRDPGWFPSFYLRSCHSHRYSVMNLLPCSFQSSLFLLLMSRLTGFVWSIPIAFLLVFIGSILGESLLFLSFRHFLHSRIVQFRKEHEDNYGTIVLVINQHKRWMIFLIRLSAIPVLNSMFRKVNNVKGHFSTPLFSSIDEIEYREWLYMVIATSWKVTPSD
jgi:hypothetical protein